MQRFGEVDLTAHGALGHLRHLGLAARAGSEQFDDLVLDERRIDVEDDESAATAREPGLGDARVVGLDVPAELQPAPHLAVQREQDPLAGFVDAARRWSEAGTPVAGICGATMGLARAGLLDDRRHTSNAPEQLSPTGYAGAAHYVDAPAVTDRGVITAAAITRVSAKRTRCR